MNIEDISTNDFYLHYCNEQKILFVHPIIEGKKSEFPIEIKLDTLLDMGKNDASKWIGETILILITEMREKLFSDPKESE